MFTLDHPKHIGHRLYIHNSANMTNIEQWRGGLEDRPNQEVLEWQGVLYRSHRHSQGAVWCPSVNEC